jgi:hypothetical protein
VARGFVVEMERLRIELRGEPLYIGRADFMRTGDEGVADLEVVEIERLLTPERVLSRWGMRADRLVGPAVPRALQLL